MASNDGRGSGGRGETRRQATPGAPTGKGLGSTRKGDTVPSGGPASELPKQFGRYQIRKLLGGGGMGAVYLAYNTELEREEALKVPHFDAGTDPDVRERFLREARSAAKLDHPNLCPIYDVGVLDGIYYLTMRFLKGNLLSDYVGTPQPVRRTVEVMAKLALALQTAHDEDVIHRDLKPGNVIMCPGTGPTVMDFGLARQARQGDQRLTQDGTMLGTPAYMPPEQLQGKLDQVGPRSDVYALGVILYELLTGRLPFVAGTIPELYGMILRDEPPKPSQLRADLPAALDDVCARAMARSPGQRYASMRVFAQALLGFLKSAGPLDAGNLVPHTGSAGPSMRSDILAAATKAPAAPAAGNRADILATPTVPPLPKSQAGRVTTPPLPPAGRKSSAVRKPAPATAAAPPPAEADADEEPGSSSGGGIVVWVVCGLLMLAGLGGLGVLAYTLTQKKSSSGEIAKAEIDARQDGVKKESPGKVVGQGGVASDDKGKVEQPRERSKPPGSGAEATPRPAPPPENDARVVLFEDFQKTEEGGRPEGWQGDAFSVLKRGGRLCLTVTEPKPTVHYVTLPRVLLPGDFLVECEFRLGGALRNKNAADHEFHLRLSGKDVSPLPVVVTHLGQVKLDTSSLMPTEGFKQGEDIRFRLTRKKDIFNVAINGVVTTGKTIPGKGAFDEIRIGLTGGARPRGAGVRGAGILAQLYSVKVTSLQGKDREGSTSRPSGQETVKGGPKESRPGPTDDSEPAVAIRKATQEYEAAMKTAREALLASFDRQVELLGKAKINAEVRLALIEVVKAEKEEFDRKGRIPWSSPMLPSTVKYLGALTVRQRALAQEYDKAIDSLLKSNETDEAKACAARKQEALRPVVLATWTLRVGNRPVKHDLYSNGRVGTPGSSNAWDISRGLLLFRWPNRAARGGVWVDTCIVSADGKSFSGKNQKGVVVTGVRVSGTD